MLNDSCCLQMYIHCRIRTNSIVFFVRSVKFSKFHFQIVNLMLNQIKKYPPPLTIHTFIGLCIRSVMKISVPRGALWSVFLGPLFCILSCPSSIDITIVTYKLAAWASFRRMKFTPSHNKKEKRNDGYKFILYMTFFKI